MNFQSYTRFKHALTLMATDKRIRDVGGHPVKVHGTVQTLVLIGSKEYDVTFIMMDSPENILLSAHFLSTYNVKVDFGNAFAHFGRAELVLRHEFAEPTLTFALPTDIVVPANSEMAVQLRVKPSKLNSVANNVPLFFEPRSRLTDSGVLLGRCLTTSTHLIALLLNHTEENIPIPATQTPINKV